MYDTTTCCNKRQFLVKPMKRGVLSAGCCAENLCLFHLGIGGRSSIECAVAANGKLSTIGRAFAAVVGLYLGPEYGGGGLTLSWKSWIKFGALEKSSWTKKPAKRMKTKQRAAIKTCHRRGMIIFENWKRKMDCWKITGDEEAISYSRGSTSSVEPSLCKIDEEGCSLSWYDVAEDGTQLPRRPGCKFNEKSGANKKEECQWYHL